MRRRLLTLTAILAAGLFTIAPARAGFDNPDVVSTDPVDWTPHVLDGTVYAFAVLDDTVVVGGEFTSVADAEGHAFDRSNVFAFSLTDGHVLPFAPRTDGPVRALATEAGAVFAGGEFHHVNGAARHGLAKLRPDGGLDAAFRTGIDDSAGLVRALAARGDRLYVAGDFATLGGVSRRALARVDAGTGQVDPAFDLALARPDGKVWVQSMAMSRDGAVMVFDGTFTSVSGQDRYQLAVARTGGARAEVAGWATDVVANSPCNPDYETYLRGVDVSADGSWFVLVTSGHAAGPDLVCNSAARFDTDGGAGQRPVWVNHTGGNTLLSVAVTDGAVYVGGHQQWLDNPYGNKYPGRGAVARPGIGAVDPDTGRALSWNPTKDRGVGTEALLAFEGGLLVGSDTEHLGREYHARLGIFPPAS
ncbi:PKD domain containing protein [Longispora sp. K20-0274]|uniref:PKD domain containing protein n=1 Tax=Longispora sp. K20-0274 TaxID=3088255 RepID=UPI00399B5731